jgi:hypothetical protein
VAGEAAGRVDRVCDHPDDRVRVRRHVVAARPGPPERRTSAGRIPRAEPAAPVLDEVVANLRRHVPAQLGLRHREAQAVAVDAPEVKAVLLDRHRQVPRNAVHRPDVDELADERADRELDPACGRDSTRIDPAGDHEPLGVERQRIRTLAHLDAQRRRALDERPRDAGRIGHAVLAADGRAEHVVHTQAAHERRVDALDRHAERHLELAPVLELGEAGLRRRQEEVADLLEQRLPELLEEPHARPRELHLGGGRELLPHAAHRPAGRTACDLPHVGEHDAFRSAQRQVVRDRSADRAGARYNDSSHPRSSSRSPSLS